jgi:hypothetical protein
LQTDFETEVLLNESNFLPKYLLQEYTYRVGSRTNSPGERLAELNIETKTLVREANIRHFDFRENLLTREEDILTNFPNEKKQHQERMDLFLQSQLNMRRQHALQHELEERKKRLNDMRDIRLQAIKEAREKAKVEEQRKKEEEERLAKEEKKTFTRLVSPG